MILSLKLFLFFRFLRTVRTGLLAFCLVASAMSQPTTTNPAFQAVVHGTHLFSSNFVKVYILDKS